MNLKRRVQQRPVQKQSKINYFVAAISILLLLIAAFFVLNQDKEEPLQVKGPSFVSQQGVKLTSQQDLVDIQNQRQVDFPNSQRNPDWLYYLPSLTGQTSSIYCDEEDVKYGYDVRCEVFGEGRIVTFSDTFGRALMSYNYDSFELAPTQHLLEVVDNIKESQKETQQEQLSAPQSPLAEEIATQLSNNFVWDPISETGTAAVYNGFGVGASIWDSDRKNLIEIGESQGSIEDFTDYVIFSKSGAEYPANIHIRVGPRLCRIPDPSQRVETCIRPVD